jgi:hypothetical protein
VLYRIFGLALASDVPLPELPRAAAARPALRVRARRIGPSRRRWTWTEENRAAGGGAVWLAIGCDQGDWLLRFPRLADFEITDGGTTISARARAGVPPRTLRHLLIDVVVPMALSARGHLLVHASGIDGPAGAALFVGRTGAGKSTLAASFDGAFRPFSDDAVRVVVGKAQVQAIAAYAGARLWPDALSVIARGRRTQAVAHYTTKRRVRATPAPARVRVGAVYVLRPAARGARVAVTPLSRRGAVVALLSHVYCLDARDAATARRQLDAATALTAAMPVFALTVPRDLGRLGELRRAVVQHLDAVTTRHG